MNLLILSALFTSLLHSGTAAPTQQSAPPPAKATYRFTSGDHAPAIPFELNSNKIYFRARVENSPPLWFILDSGSPFTVLDIDTARRLGLPLMDVKTADSSGAGEGKETSGRTKFKVVHLPGLDFFPANTQAIALDRVIAGFEGRHPDGLIGGELFSRLVVEIDYERHTLHFYDPATFHYTGTGTSIPITIQDWMFVKATVTTEDGTPLEGSFLVDTGVRLALTLNTPFVNTNHLLTTGGKKVKTVLGGGVGGAVEHYLGRIKSLKFGSLTIDSPVTTFSQDSKSVFAVDAFQGLIGAEILKRYRVFVDYPHNRLILEPGPHSDAPYEFDASGMFLVAEGKDLRTFKVFAVTPGSPAAEAGIQKGDMIEQVDGKPASALTLQQLRDLMVHPGDSHALAIRHGSDQKQVQITLRRIV